MRFKLLVLSLVVSGACSKSVAQSSGVVAATGWIHTPVVRRAAKPMSNSLVEAGLLTRPGDRRHVAAHAGTKPTPILATPPVFISMSTTIGPMDDLLVWRKADCLNHSFRCGLGAPITRTMCTSTEQCARHLKVALLQAKEFNDDVILLEQGNGCANFCRQNNISYQNVPWDNVEHAFCLTQPPDWGAVWSASTLRWFVLNDFIQGRLFGHNAAAIVPPTRFNYADHDMMIYANSSEFFHRFGDAEMAVCSFHPNANGVYSLFTKDSLQDLIRHFLNNARTLAPHDMYMLMSYRDWGVPREDRECWYGESDSKQKRSRIKRECDPISFFWDRINQSAMQPPLYTMYNSCDAFPDGRVHDFVARRGSGFAASRELQTFYRKGLPHYRFENASTPKYSGRWRPTSRSPFDRVFATHFGTSEKQYMEMHFRLNPGSVRNENCRICLQGDCDMPDCSSKTCFEKCLSSCAELREFKAKLNA